MADRPMLREDAFQGKTILITGGGTGLGKSMGKRLMELGANLVITGRRQKVLDETAQEFHSEFDKKILPLSCDVRKPDEIENAKDEAVKEFGTIDGLINNAAGNFISPTEKLSPNAFGAIIDIVLKGTFNCTLALGKHWIKEQQEQAAVLNIATTYASTGSGFVVPSACAKAGVVALTRSLAVEWAKYNIRTNAVAPGSFPTKGAWDRLMPDMVKEKIDPAGQVPLKRVGEHHELADLASFLLSDFSSYMNGEVVTIDGGQWLKGAGQFNKFDDLPPEMWEEIEKAVRNASRGQNS